MKYNTFNVVRYDADKGNVFDWKEPRYIEHEDGTKEQEHLNSTTLFIGAHDSIENYVEVTPDGEIRTLLTPSSVVSEKEEAYNIIMGEE